MSEYSNVLGYSEPWGGSFKFDPQNSGTLPDSTTSGGGSSVGGGGSSTPS